MSSMVWWEPSVGINWCWGAEFRITDLLGIFMLGHFSSYGLASQLGVGVYQVHLLFVVLLPWDVSISRLCLPSWFRYLSLQPPVLRREVQDCVVAGKSSDKLGDLSPWGLCTGQQALLADLLDIGVHSGTEGGEMEPTGWWGEGKVILAVGCSSMANSKQVGEILMEIVSFPLILTVKRLWFSPGVCVCTLEGAQ